MLRPIRNFFRYVPPTEARAVMISVFVGLAMLGIKTLAYLRTGSAAILSDALEGIVNVVASAFAAYSLSTAHRPADREHPYGHGKIEFLSAAFEGGMIVLAALVILAEAALGMWRIRRGAPTVREIDYGLLLILVAMIVHGLLGLYLVRSGKRNNSLTLEADGWHLLADSLTSATVIVALLVVRFTGFAYADPIGALVIGAYITTTGWHLIRRAAAGLMDEQDVADEKLLTDLLDAHVRGDKPPRVCSYHKLRHRHSGRYHWVDFHLMVPAWWDIRRGHEVASSIEYEIEQAIAEGNATAHVEPCKDEFCSSCTEAGAESQPDV